MIFCAPCFHHRQIYVDAATVALVLALPQIIAALVLALPVELVLELQLSAVELVLELR